VSVVEPATTHARFADKAKKSPNECAGVASRHVRPPLFVHSTPWATLLRDVKFSVKTHIVSALIGHTVRTD
jgi:hypothetical protein